MSFFSTADILKSLITGNFIQSIVSSVDFKSALDSVDVEKYISKELIEQVISNIFANTEVKKQLQNMIIDLIFEMKEDGYVIINKNRNDPQRI